MKNKKILSIVGVLAVIANLGLASIAFGQTSTGQVNVGCVGGITVPVVAITAPVGATPFNFTSATYGTTATNSPIDGVEILSFTVTDGAGYDPTAGECEAGVKISMAPTTVDTEFFHSLSGLNHAALPNALTASGQLSVGGTSVTASDGTALLEYTEDEPLGLVDTNIELVPSAGGTFAYAAGWNSIDVLTSDESFDGTVTLTYAAHDITLDIPGTTPVDTYSKEIIITAARA
jgi:hypothetical protein